MYTISGCSLLLDLRLQASLRTIRCIIMCDLSTTQFLTLHMCILFFGVFIRVCVVSVVVIVAIAHKFCHIRSVATITIVTMIMIFHAHEFVLVFCILDFWTLEFFILDFSNLDVILISKWFRTWSNQFFHEIQFYRLHFMNMYNAHIFKHIP